MTTIKVEIVWFMNLEAEWSSKLIMKSMKKNYSHVAIIGTALNGKKYVCHAVDQGVCYEDLNEYLKTHQVVRSKMVNLNCSQEVLEAYIQGEAGKEYSDTQLIAIALFAKPNTRVGKWIRTKLANGDSKRICSEFVAAVLRHYCTEYTMPEDLDYVTPSDLEDILQPTIIELAG